MHSFWARFRSHLHIPHRRRVRPFRDSGDIIGYTTDTDGGDW